MLASLGRLPGNRPMPRAQVVAPRHEAAAIPTTPPRANVLEIVAEWKRRAAHKSRQNVALRGSCLRRRAGKIVGERGHLLLHPSGHSPVGSLLSSDGKAWVRSSSTAQTILRHCALAFERRADINAFQWESAGTAAAGCHRCGVHERATPLLTVSDITPPWCSQDRRVAPSCEASYRACLLRASLPLGEHRAPVACRVLSSSSSSASPSCLCRFVRQALQPICHSRPVLRVRARTCPTS
ncbi:hypothetical protein OH77DRAFT_372906 [Trametes cingulata]|nr:hypothetical protein OH77DRAFT_372906 [Trametes cingulata]